LGDVKPVGQSWAPTMEKASDTVDTKKPTRDNRHPTIRNQQLTPTATPDNQQTSLDIEPHPTAKKQTTITKDSFDNQTNTRKPTVNSNRMKSRNHPFSLIN
jgi:hypothetical protein